MTKINFWGICALIVFLLILFFLSGCRPKKPPGCFPIQHDMLEYETAMLKHFLFLVVLALLACLCFAHLPEKREVPNEKAKSINK